LSTPKSFLFHIFASYSSLLKELRQLNQHGIYFFDLSVQHLFVKKNNQTLPLLCDFQNSLLKIKLKEEYIITMLSNVSDYTCKPLEVHVLFYLAENGEETLTYSYIETIIDVFIETKPFFSLFSCDYKEKYKQDAIVYLKPLINQPKSAIIQKMLAHANTWDNYSLSILFLHLVGNAVRCFKVKKDFLNHYLILLLKNVSPNPLKRENWEQTSKAWEKLFTHFKDWGFVKSIPLQKMKKLRELL